MALQLDPIKEAIAEIAAGRPVIVVDDEDRENEGDLIMAASLATTEWVGFIIRHSGGVLCAPLTKDDADRLELAPMVSKNDAPLATAFTVSVDYREGLTTGISAEERCNTVRALANNNVGAAGFVRPGHVFPLVAREGGVLIRTGHTEAAVDLARLADLPPVGLISEMTHDDGSLMRGPALQAFAKEHQLKLISIDDLIAYRQQREQLVERVGETMVETEFGPAQARAFTTPFDPYQHLALVFGDLGNGTDVPVRLHRETALGDVFNAPRSPVSRAMAKIAQEGRGVVVYLREGGVGVSQDTQWGG
ncbi:MAG: 3,4-dihydroxy-2-butanone-4-phosphate synthase, partial [Pseudomonadota bacterium]